MRELYCNTIAIRSVDRAFNTPGNISFERLDINFDGDTWTENEPVILTLAGTIAFKGVARQRAYDLSNERVSYDAVDGLVWLAKNACPVVHEYYNRVKANPADNEPINQTIHAILQAEFATLVTTTATRNFMVVNSLDTSAANSVMPGDVSPKDKTFIEFLETLCGFQPMLRYYLDYGASTASSPFPAGILKLVDTANLTDTPMNLVVAQGARYTAATTVYNVEDLKISYNSDDCVDAVDMVGSQYFEVKEQLTGAWTPTWSNVATEFVGWTLDTSPTIFKWNPLQWSDVQSVVVTDAASPGITYTAPVGYAYKQKTGYIQRGGAGSITNTTTVNVAYQYMHPDAYRRFSATYDVAQFRLETYAGTVGIHPQPIQTWARWYLVTTGATPYQALDRWQPNYDVPSGNENSPIVYFVERQNLWETRVNTDYPYTLRVPWNRDLRMQYTGRTDYTVSATTGATKWNATVRIPARSFFIYSDIDSAVIWNDTTKLTRLALAQLDANQNPKVSGTAQVTLPTTVSTWNAVFDLGKRVNVTGTSCTTWATLGAVINRVNYAGFDSGTCELGIGREDTVLNIIYPEPEINDIPEKYLNTWAAPASNLFAWSVTTPNP